MYLSGAGLVRWRLTALPVFAGVLLLILNSGVASGFCQDAAVAVASEEKPVPILSGSAGYFTFVNGGQAELNPQFNPVLLLPLGDRWLVEGRGEFEGAFQ